ncbi:MULTISPECIES: recombinase family protein [unclassified Rhodococcus (in: high G+C Gram-positive bacteria)]|uniref:recombinase family protein n=1 Tax=unclassified Rhodococcus (in: high G+C Gram-positive bacteria) TaxID=192944 RepID=UPI002955A5F3|nr:recombinase family protein [Rhodococcus sp. IEGM 1343]MDV8055076.1 recombinase family protein [Rhodococcus sp. IEGM 1343]
MRAIIYTRVSADQAGNQRSVTEQERECRALCEREGWEVADVLTDNDIGASRWSGKDRPAYARLTEVLKPGDVLVTWEASRAQRDLSAYVQLRDLCAERGVLWSYSGRTYDLTKGEDRFGTGLDALMAEREADDIRKRVKRAMTQNLADGKPHGRTPYGYRAVRNDAGKFQGWVINEETATHVREAARRVLAGDTIRSISRDFDSRGIPTPGGKVAEPGDKRGAWNSPSLRRMILNPTIAGLRVHDGKVAGPGTWEALISEDDHYKLTALLNDKTRLTHRGTRPASLLTGIALCGVCATTVAKKRSRSESYYICPAKGCVARTVRLVDPLVEELVVSWLERVDVLSFAAEDDPAAATKLAELQGLRARLETFTDSAAQGEITPAALGRIESQLLPQIEAAEAQLSSRPVVLAVEDVAGVDAREAWEGLPIERKRQVIYEILTVRIDPTGSGRGFKPDALRFEWRYA